MPVAVAPTTGPLGVVRITNHAAKPFKSKYANQSWTIQPHSEALVPWEAACLWLGNPAAIDIDAKRRHRTDEYKRLRVKYGVYEKDALIEAQFPKLEVYDMEGNRLTMVMDDPDGATVTIQSSTVSDNEMLKVQLAALQHQVTQLSALVSDTVPDMTVEDGVATLPHELPHDATVDALMAQAGQTANMTGDDEGPAFTEDSPTRLPVS